MTKNEERLEALEKRWETIDRRVEFCVSASTWIVLGFCLIYTTLRFSGLLKDECNPSEAVFSGEGRWELVE